MNDLSVVDNVEIPLLYRLNLITVHLPALRERPSDIPLLAAHFLDNIAKVYRHHDLKIGDRALAWLQSLKWPGNIRQLKQLIERTVLVSDKDVLEVDDFALPMEMEAAEAREIHQGSLPEVGSMSLDDMEREMIVKCLHHYGGNISRVADALGLSRAALYRRMEKYGIEV